MTDPQYKETLANFLQTCRTQFILQGVNKGDTEHQRQVIQKLLAPYRALEPHDNTLIEAMLISVDSTQRNST